MRSDLHDELDQRLRADGARWRAATTTEDETTVPPALLRRDHEDRPTRSRRLRSRLAITASVAAVIAVALTVAVSRPGPSRRPAGPIDTPQPTVSAGTGYGQVSPGTHPCDAAEFELLGVSDRPGSVGVIITASLEDVAKTACSMPGHGPLARLLDANGSLLAQGSDATLSAISPIVVPPGAHVDVSARWFSICHLASPATRMQLRLQGPLYEKGAREFGTYITVSLRDIPTPGCTAQEQRDPSNIAGMPVPRTSDTRTASVSPSTRSTTTGGLVPPDSTSTETAHGCTPDKTVVVTFTIDPDGMRPGCAIVGGTQRLRVVNATNGFHQHGFTVTVHFAGLPPRTLKIGQSTTYDMPFGTYLARGQHYMQVSNFGNSNFVIWLK